MSPERMEAKAETRGGLDAVTLIRDHAGRVALIVGLVAVTVQTVHASFPPESLFGGAVLAAKVLFFLLLLNWLKMEMQLIRRRSKLPPGDVGYPLVGTLPKIIQIGISSNKWAIDQKEKYGDIYTENALYFLTITAAEDAISWLWNSERKGLSEGSWPPAISLLIGAGAVANTNGKRHRALRRILDPAFTPAATRDYLLVIDQVTLKVLEEWSTPLATNNINSQQAPFHSSEVFKMYALRLFFIAAFGREGEPHVLEELHDNFKLWLQGFGALIPYPIPGTLLAKSMKARKRILDIVENLIVVFKQENPPNTERAKKSMMGRACYGVDEAGEPMSMEDLKDNILNMIFAGHDTTFASMGTAVHWLCQIPMLRRLLIEEVRKFKEPLDFDELKNAPILNAFLAESWRQNPPVPQAQRKMKQTAEYNGYEIPEGSFVAYSVVLMSKNKHLYPKPDSFEIQRFLPKDHPLIDDPELRKAAEGVDINSLKANYPIFGGGTHACLGSHFAKLEMRVLVTRLLQSYDIEEKNPERFCFPFGGWKNEFRLAPTKRLVAKS